jgi:tellurite resistance protein
MSAPLSAVPASAPAPRPTAYPAVGVFASVMGIAALGLAWRAAVPVIDAPAPIGEGLLALAAVLFVVLAAIYAIKSVRATALVRAEYADAATSSNFGTIVIAVSLLAASAVPYSTALATALWIIAVVSGAGLLIALLGTWIAEPVPTAKITPGWFIPVVGNATTAYAGTALGHDQVAWASFAIAVIFWLTLQPLVFYRLIFAERLPPRAAPTLGVLVSSPAVMASAWFELTGGGGPVFAVLLFGALFFALLVVRLWRLTTGMGFSITAWGYTFPAAALAGALVRYHASVPGPVGALLAQLGLALATAIVAIVFARSLRALASLTRVLRSEGK